MSNRRNGVLYVGVTSNLSRRALSIGKGVNPEWDDLYDRIL
jgi:predicted GIY-YIG superfamily endonuclease